MPFIFSFVGGAELGSVAGPLRGEPARHGGAAARQGAAHRQAEDAPQERPRLHHPQDAQEDGDSDIWRRRREEAVQGRALLAGQAKVRAEQGGPAQEPQDEVMTEIQTRFITSRLSRSNPFYKQGSIIAL